MELKCLLQLRILIVPSPVLYLSKRKRAGNIATFPPYWVYGPQAQYTTLKSLFDGSSHPGRPIPPPPPTGEQPLQMVKSEEAIKGPPQVFRAATHGKVLHPGEMALMGPLRPLGLGHGRFRVLACQPSCLARAS